MMQIAVTGMGCLCSSGNSIPDIMAYLENQEPCNSQPHMFPPSDEGNPVFSVKERSFEETRANTAADTLILARLAAKEAMLSAQFPQVYKNEKTSLGICIGTTSGSSPYFLNSYVALRDHKSITPDSKWQKEIDAYFESSLSIELAHDYNATGPLATVSNACTSGTDAIGIACQWLMMGLCDYVLAGGADALSYIPYVGFARLMIYDNGLCKPFSVNRKGLNLGEGAGLLLLETKEHALERGVTPLGYVCGYGCANDAYHLTAPHPEGRGLKNAILKATQDMPPEKIAFINAHGTGTPENDRIEAHIINTILPEMPVWGTKAYTGHTLGAAGGIEAVLTLQALIDKKIPVNFSKTRNENSFEGGVDLITKSRSICKNYALSSSLGFGGGSSALLLAGA